MQVLEGTSDMAETLIGTPYYMSPEIFQNKVSLKDTVTACALSGAHVTTCVPP
jgi:serine/threonine protein kinase